MHLCLLFNAMISHSFVPADFCFGIIVPLLKDKQGDATRLQYVSRYNIVQCCL